MGERANLATWRASCNSRGSRTKRLPSSNSCGSFEASQPDSNQLLWRTSNRSIRLPFYSHLIANSMCSVAASRAACSLINGVRFTRAGQLHRTVEAADQLSGFNHELHKVFKWCFCCWLTTGVPLRKNRLIFLRRVALPGSRLTL